MLPASPHLHHATPLPWQDCEFTYLSVQILHLLGEEGPATKDPGGWGAGWAAGVGRGRNTCPEWLDDARYEAASLVAVPWTSRVKHCIMP